jgi:hypothetical protein
LPRSSRGGGRGQALEMISGNGGDHGEQTHPEALAPQHPVYMPRHPTPCSYNPVGQLSRATQPSPVASDLISTTRTAELRLPQHGATASSTHWYWTAPRTPENLKHSGECLGES